MHAAEVLENQVHGNGSNVVFDFLREPVGAIGRLLLWKSD
jgi:hypothetical protein